jgi:protein-S-isoprenylcysteine O-methyltransferase Ste14
MSDNPSGAIHPTIFMFLWVVLSIGLQYFWPFNISELGFLELFGRILIVFGGVLMIWAQITFRRYGTTTDHSKPTTSLITKGPFRFSRNPIYLAMILIFAGVALFYNTVWGLILVIPFGIALLFLTIRPEEDYLEQEFGSDYTRYQSLVRRWI